jgi:hypothetical protein
MTRATYKEVEQLGMSNENGSLATTLRLLPAMSHSTAILAANQARIAGCTMLWYSDGGGAVGIPESGPYDFFLWLDMHQEPALRVASSAAAIRDFETEVDPVLTKYRQAFLDAHSVLARADTAEILKVMLGVAIGECSREDLLPPRLQLVDRPDLEARLKTLYTNAIATLRTFAQRHQARPTL